MEKQVISYGIRP